MKTDECLQNFQKQFLKFNVNFGLKTYSIIIKSYALMNYFAINH